MLTLTNVRKTFGKTVAVDSLSLSVRKGELFGLLAPDTGTIAIELPATHGGPPTLVVTTNGTDRRVQTAEPLAGLNRIATTIFA